MDAICNANPTIKKLWSFSIVLDDKFLNGRSQLLQLIRQELGFVLPSGSYFFQTDVTNTKVLTVAISFNGTKVFSFHPAVGGQKLQYFNSSASFASSLGFPMVMKLKENRLLVRVYSLNSSIDTKLNNFHEYTVGTINDEKEDLEDL